ncbi:MAG TPA: TlpA disulfide reductase family protein [Vicinamibacterales bacterium]|nr:TlpA disulfide reductase family protein [Vicinamibacterales bacterium]
MSSLTLVAAFAIASMQQAAAPQPPLPDTPADCVKTVREFVVKRQQQLRPPTGLTADIVRQVEKEKTALANECAAKFDLTTIAIRELPSLADLYTEAVQPDLAKRALDRAMAATDLPAADRAVVLAQAVRSGLREPKGAERNARLETFVDELDRLPATVFDQKFAAHNSMNNYYRADDIDAGIIKHSMWIINAAETFSPEVRQKLGMNVGSAYANLAEAWAGQGMNDKALELLGRGQTEWKDVPRVNDAYLSPLIARLKLVGTAGTSITAPRWLNMPEGKTSIEMPGPVTLLEFTAHWCGPCKESYPGLKRLLAKYGPQGFRIVFATELYGYFGTERNLEPAVEFEKDREYFTTKEGFDVPIAVGDRPTPEMVNGRPVYTPDKNFAAYKVGGIPQIQLIDRQGRIRLIMVGYDEANEPKLGKIIEDLLKDK